MNIFVVNLEKDKLRHESIKSQFDELQLSFEFFRGISGSALSDDQLSILYSKKKAERYQCRPLTPSEIGCALSHVGVYREIVRRKISSALILEDDVVLPKTFADLITKCQKATDLDKPEVILLSPAVGIRDSKHIRTISLEYEILPYKKGYYTSSYIITYYAALALLKELFPVGDVADCWERMMRYKVVELFVINPPVILQNQELFGSSTTQDIQKIFTENFFRKIIFKSRRFFFKFIDLFYATYRRNFVPYAGIHIERYPKKR